MSEWVNEWVSEWMSEWMSEWVNEWVSEWVSESTYRRKRHMMQEWLSLRQTKVCHRMTRQLWEYILLIRLNKRKPTKKHCQKWIFWTYQKWIFLSTNSIIIKMKSKKKIWIATEISLSMLHVEATKQWYFEKREVFVA
jgi:hypothetical protein